MVQLQNDLKEIEAVGIQVVGVSFDSVEVLKKFAESNPTDFPLLSDEGSKTIKAYGIHNKGGLPHPMTIVIDQAGTVRAKLVREGYAERHPNSELIAAGKKIQ